MKQLLESYRKKVLTLNELIKGYDEDDSKVSLTVLRLRVKASCYRTFIVELEREIAVVEENFKNLA